MVEFITFYRKTGQDVVPDEERREFEKEFDDYQQKLQKAKEEYVETDAMYTSGGQGTSVVNSCTY